MGEPLKIKRIEDMSRLSWLEHVITEASLMTRSIRLHSILMNWMCFPLQVWRGFAPPAKNLEVWGAATPSQNFSKKILGEDLKTTGSKNNDKPLVF